MQALHRDRVVAVLAGPVVTALDPREGVVDRLDLRRDTVVEPHQHGGEARILRFLLELGRDVRVERQNLVLGRR